MFSILEISMARCKDMHIASIDMGIFHHQPPSTPTTKPTLNYLFTLFPAGSSSSLSSSLYIPLGCVASHAPVNTFFSPALG